MTADSTSWLTRERALERIAGLQEELEACRGEIGTLKLQLDILATTDSVTGLPNVHGMVELIEDAGHRLARTGEPFAVMMVRVPELEVIHSQGEPDVYREALRHTAALIVAGLRQVDKVGRLDTATFVATLPSLTHQGVDGVVDRLTKLLHAVPLTLADRRGFRLQPEIAVVLSREGGTVEVPVLLDFLYDGRDAAGFRAPVISEAPAADKPYEIHLA